MAATSAELHSQTGCNAVVKAVVDVMVVLINHVVRAMAHIPFTATSALTCGKSITNLRAGFQHEFHSFALLAPTHLHQQGELEVIDAVAVGVAAAVLNLLFPAQIRIVQFHKHTADGLEIFLADVAETHTKLRTDFAALLDCGTEIHRVHRHAAVYAGAEVRTVFSNLTGKREDGTP